LVFLSFVFSHEETQPGLYEAQEVLQMIGTLFSQELGNLIPN